MNKLILLLSTILLTAPVIANTTLTIVKLDLDGDKIQDTVSEKILNQKNNRLEIKLSSTNSTHNFDNILPRAVVADGVLIGCSSEKSNLFSIIKDDDKRLVEVRMQTSDLESCNRESHTTIQIAYINKKLVVSELSRGSESYSSGDPSPSFEYKASLNKSHWASTFEYKNRYDRRMDYGVSAKLVLPNGGCELSLADFNKSNAADPKCVSNLIEKLNVIEVVDYDF